MSTAPHLMIPQVRTAAAECFETRSVLLTGLSGSGKTTIARALAHQIGFGQSKVGVIDGDVLRAQAVTPIGFSKIDRKRNAEHAANAAEAILRNGGISICALIAPYQSIRDEMRCRLSRFGKFKVVYLSTPIEECERRDPKGLYRRVRCGEITEFTGISSPYEPPFDADIILDTTGRTVEECSSYIAGVLFATAPTIL